MNITKQRFIDIHTYALGAAIILYIIGIFGTKVLQPGILFVFGTGFFNLFHHNYFAGRIKLAAHMWLFPTLIGALTYPVLLEKEPSGHNALYFALTLIISLTPFLLLITGKTDENPHKKERLTIVSARIMCQTLFFIFYATGTAFALIKGSPIKGSLSRDKTTHRQKIFLFLSRSFG